MVITRRSAATLILFFLLIKTFAQDDNAKIVNDSYIECFGRMATDAELNTWMQYVKTHNATTGDLIAMHIKNIKDSPAMQKNIIKKAYEDAYGGSRQTETDSCFKIRTNKPGGVYTYHILINDLKNNLRKNKWALQFTAIQNSYYDYFGVHLKRTDENAKEWLSIVTLDSGIEYRNLMEAYRLYIIKKPEEQKAVISRAFNAVFEREPKIAEMDRWYDVWKYAGCPYTALLKQYNDYKSTHPKPMPPILPPPGAGIPVYTRGGLSLNEACNCTGEKIYLINADERSIYKVIISLYDYKSNSIATTEYVVKPKEEKFIGCTKDLECLYSLTYSVVRYTKM